MLLAPAFVLFWEMRPDRVDVWIASELGRQLGVHPVVDLGIQSAIVHNILGGFWFAAVVFVLWTGKGKERSQVAERRIETMLVGSALAVTLALLCGSAWRWEPPNHNGALAHFFPSYLLPNPNQNSFPSASTALYSSVAAGVVSLCRPAGLVLWVLVFCAVGLPRMYVGGHYASDVVAGALLGLAGYFVARKFIEPMLPRVTSHLSIRFLRSPWLRITQETLIFFWIVELAVGFREVAWTAHILEYLARRGLIH